MRLSETEALDLVETGCWRCLPENTQAKDFTVCAACDRDFLFEVAGIKVWFNGSGGMLWMVKPPEVPILFFYNEFDAQAMMATPEIGWSRALKLLRSIARVRREHPERFICWRIEQIPNKYPVLLATRYVSPGAYIGQIIDAQHAA